MLSHESVRADEQFIFSSFFIKNYFFLIKGLALRNCINTLSLFDDSFFLYQAMLL
nr:hypothetical protein BAR15_110079 [Bartonella sp. AR 15-3]